MGQTTALVAALLVASTSCGGRPPHRDDAGSHPGAHPLDALTAAELSATVKLLRDAGKLSARNRISTIYLQEPPKAAILSAQPVSRQAFAVITEPAENKTFEAIVDVTRPHLVSWTEKPGVQAAVTGQDSALADQIVRGDARWREAMRRRGIVLLENVSTVSWPAGYFGFPLEENARVVRVVAYYKGRSNNAIARPIEGVVADVNLTALKILRFSDRGQVPLSSDDGAYSSPAQNRQRVSPGPDRGLSQVSLINGEVAWKQWRFHFAAHPREGVVIHQVRYIDQGRARSVLYRASVVEMVVPYGDPGPDWFFRNTFDVGELGLGGALLPFTPGVDCPVETRLFDAVFAGAGGQLSKQRNVIALFERPTGVAWRHEEDYEPGRELVLKFFANLGNYDYGFEWIFRTDGAMEVRVLLTGIMSVKGMADHPPNGKILDGHSFGHKVAPNLAAIHHQHFFCFRLDFDIDGQTPNRVSEINTEALPANQANPYGNGFESRQTIFRTESEGQRRTEEKSSRRWKIENSVVQNALGEPTGYVLLPGENSVPFAAPNSWIRRRGGFLNAHLWVTPYRVEEIYPAGDYPNQSKGGDGLPHWTASNRPIADQDIVIWYTLGVTHLPRPEDWPVMPVYEAGFKLLPAGFFASNPLLEHSKNAQP